jgi:hypothetical protein
LTQAAFLPQHNNNQGGSAVKNPTAYKTLHESSMEARSSLTLVRLFSTKIHKFVSNLPCELTTVFNQGWVLCSISWQRQLIQAIQDTNLNNLTHSLATNLFFHLAYRHCKRPIHVVISTFFLSVSLHSSEEFSEEF